MMDYDVFFLSHGEPTAEAHLDRLIELVGGRVKHVHGVDGIPEAHRRCASLCCTEMFYVVDADQEVSSKMDFLAAIPQHDRSYVHLWMSRNPVNGLVYGNGGIKLFPTEGVLSSSVEDQVDFCMSVGPMKIHPQTMSINRFNTTPETAFVSGFREGVKLTIMGDKESSSRLTSWKTVRNGRLNSEWASLGAEMGEDWILRGENPMFIHDRPGLKQLYLEQAYLTGENLSATGHRSVYIM